MSTTAAHSPTTGSRSGSTTSAAPGSRDRQPRRAGGRQRRRRRHHQPVDLREGARPRRAYADQVARPRPAQGLRRGGRPRADDLRRPLGLRRPAAGLRRQRRRGRPGVDRGRPAARPRHRRRTDRRGPRPVVARRPPQPLHQDPGDPRGPAGDHRRCSSEGISVNVTLIFGIERYRGVMDAFLERPGAGQGQRARPLDALLRRVLLRLRVDTEIDARLDKLGTPRSSATCAGRPASPTPGSPTRPTRRSSPPTGGRRSRPTAPTRSARCGPRPASRTRPTTTRATSSSWSPPAPSTRCPRPPSTRSPTTAWSAVTRARGTAATAQATFDAPRGRRHRRATTSSRCSRSRASQKFEDSWESLLATVRDQLAAAAPKQA